MARLYIRTTQNVDIHYEVASIGDRILARLIDYGFIAIYAVTVYQITSRIELNQTQQLIFQLPALTYDLWCETIFQGRSFGKMLLKLKVVKVDGSQASVGDYFMRWIFRLLEGGIALTPFLGLLIIMLNRRGQRLGDMAAGTTVVNLRNKASINDTLLMQVHPAYHVQFPQVAMLSDRDVRIVREALHQAMVNNNYNALGRLSAKVRQVMGVNPPMPDLQFLHIVLADYSRYSFDK